MIGRLSGALLVALALLAGPALALTSGGRAVVLQPPQPALATNFAGAAGSGAVPGPWSFSRSSNATMVNSAATLVYAPNNQLLYSSNLLNSNWLQVDNGTGSAPTVTGGYTDPNGGTTAFRVQASIGSGTGQSTVRQVVSGTGNVSSIWIKSNTGANQTVWLQTGSGQTVTATTSWQRLFIYNTVPYSEFDIGISNTVATSIDVLVWQPQLESSLNPAAGPGPYNATGASAYYGPRYDYTWGQPLLLSERIASTNLIEYSNGFSTAPWATSSVASVVSGAATSRDGTADMWLFEESSTTSAGHYLYQNISKSGSPAFYILSVDAKAATRTRLNMILSDGSGNGATMTADLSNCAAGGGIAPALEGTGITSPYAFYQQFANGICRVSLVVQSNTATQMQGLLQLDAGSGTGAANTTYAGTVGDGLYIAFAELKQQNAPDSYIPTAGAAVTRAADSITTATAGLPGWPNDAGMIVAKFITLNGPTSYSTIVGQGGAQPLFLSYTGGHTTFEFYDGSSNLVFSGSIPVGALAKVGASWGGGVRSVTAGGATPTVGTYHAGSMGPLGTIGLGSQNGDALSPLWFYEVDIWSGKRPADAVLKNKTSANDNFFQPRQAAA